MKKVISAFMVGVLLAGNAWGTEQETPRPSPSVKDSWKGKDKAMHFGVSFVLGFAARNQWKDEPGKAFLVALIPGVVKEATDQKASGKDMVANALGAALGVYSAGWIISRNQGQTVVAYQREF